MKISNNAQRARISWGASGLRTDNRPPFRCLDFWKTLKAFLPPTHINFFFCWKIHFWKLNLRKIKFSQLHFLKIHFEVSSSLASVVSLHPGECYSIAGVTTSQVCSMFITSRFRKTNSAFDSTDWLSSYPAVVLSQVQGWAIWARWESFSTWAGIQHLGGNRLTLRWEPFRALEWEFFSTWVGTP